MAQSNRIQVMISSRCDDKFPLASGVALGKFAPAGVSAAKLSSNVYLSVCYYVHGRYPEIMDLYGGLPGPFHCSGMSGTPKDFENLETFIETATLGCVMMVQALSLRHLVEADPTLAKWYTDSLSKVQLSIPLTGHSALFLWSLHSSSPG